MLLKRSKRTYLTFALVWVAMCCPLSTHAGSLRFFGNGVNDIDRVKIRIDDPTNNNPGPPADIGSTDFTIEFWLRSAPTANSAPTVNCGANNNWIYGNIAFDHDRYNQGRAFGISLGAGRVVFGIYANSSSRTICGTTNVRDNAWHHVAIQRRRADGQLWLYVDGTLQAQAGGPTGDVSYPDDGIPGNFCGNQTCTNSDPFIVLGAEKHDAGRQYPSFNGWLDEVRLSTTLRYSSNFTPSQTAFAADAATAALYDFNEPSGTLILDSAFGGASPGELKFGGNPAGPLRDSAEPFTQSAGSVQFPSASSVVVETASAMNVSVTRVGGSVGPVSVSYTTVAGTATPGADYVTAVGTLSWGDGDATSKTFSVSLNDDADIESNETFSVALSNVTGGALLGLVSTTVVTIQDNETAGNPPPALTSIAPTSALAGSTPFTLTVNGSGFVNGSVVRWNGSNRSTTFGSANQLTAPIAAADIAAAGTALVTVSTPTPGGGTSSAQTFTIAPLTNPPPALTSIAPTSALAGSTPFTLTVNGSGFVNGSVVRWNGSNRSTTFGSANQLTAPIAAADIAAAGTALVTVSTPTPGGGTSSAQTFTIAVPSGGGSAPGLVAAYAFDTGSGSAIPDSSGRGNSGSTSGTSWTTAGRFGSALVFNGSNSWVTVPDSNSLDVTAMTLEAWVYPTVQPAGWRTVIAKEQAGGVIYYLHAGSESSNRPATGVYASGGERTLYGGTRLQANTWVHLAATYDGTTQRLYVNGLQVATAAQTGAIATSSGPLRIGGNAVWGEYFQGRIDEVRIYSRALSQTEIQTDMNTRVNP